MLHPTEWTDRGDDRPCVMWVHGLDAVEHCLKGDYKMSAFKDASPSMSPFNRFRNAMSENTYDYEAFNKALENQDVHDDVWKDLPSDSGDLDVDSYIEREEYIFEECFKKRELKPAINIVFEFCINANERDGHEVQRRHEKIYPMVLKAQAEGVPTRVIACAVVNIPEFKEPLRMYIVIKDWEDPIFPGIWGALKNNDTANAFLNVLMDFIVGTRHGGNGTAIGYNVTEDLPEDDEIVLVEATKLRIDR